MSPRIFSIVPVIFHVLELWIPSNTISVPWKIKGKCKHGHPFKSLKKSSSSSSWYVLRIETCYSLGLSSIRSSQGSFSIRPVIFHVFQLWILSNTIYVPWKIKKKMQSTSSVVVTRKILLLLLLLLCTGKYYTKRPITVSVNFLSVLPKDLFSIRPVMFNVL